MGSEGTLRVKVVGDVADFQKKMSDSGSTLGKFGDIAGDVAKRGFGALTKGSEDMQRAQGGFIAATGRSRTEAQLFSKDMNSLVGSANTVGVSFDDIAAAGTQVAQQFGLTGTAGTKMTDQFLAFAKVTGQDATGAVDAFDAALDAFGLPAEAAAGLMDKLVASNQKYGTDAGPEALGVLQQMAPALQAMGEDLDYGVGLLNLFEQGGLDASAAQAGLKKAIGELKPGQSMDDLIAKVGAIEDPTLRAQAAMEIFGNKAGAGLANVIKPGMTSLDEFKVSVEEAEGATQDASTAMQTDSDKIKGAFEKMTAGARTLGQDFGPALMGLQSVGGLLGPLAGKFGGLIKDLAAKLIPSAIVTGTAVGVAQGEAQAVAATGPGMVSNMGARIAALGIPLAPAGYTVGTVVGGALVAGAVFGVGALLTVGWITAMNEAKANIRADPNRVTPEDMFDARAPMWAQAKVRVAQEMQALSQGSLDAFNTEWDRGIASGLSPQAALEPARQAGLAIGASVANAVPFALQNAMPFFHQAGQDSGDEVVTGFEVGLTPISDATRAALMPVSGVFVQHAEAWATAMREKAWGIGNDTPGAFSEGLRSDFSSVRTAFTDLKDLMANTLSPIKQEAELIAIATSKRMAKALADGRPEVRGEAQQIALDTIAQLHRLDATSPEIGRLAMKLLAGATEAEKPAIRDALDAILGVFTSPQNTNYVQTGGTNIAGAWRRAVIAELGSNATSRQIGAAVRSAMGAAHGESPPKEGPLMHIDKWGANIAAAWVSGVVGRLRLGVSEISSTLAAMGNGAAGLVGAPGLSLAGAGAAAGGGYAGAPITVNAYGQDDVERQLERYDRRRRLRGSLQGG